MKTTHHEQHQDREAQIARELDRHPGGAGEPTEVLYRNLDSGNRWILLKRALTGDDRSHRATHARIRGESALDLSWLAH
mgnify:FL=1